MKLLVLSTAVTLFAASSVSAPAAHMNSVKRAAITTQTFAMDRKTIIQVVDGVVATEIVLTTITDNFTETDTDASCIFSYSASDSEGIINRLHMALSDFFFGDLDTTATGTSLSTGTSTITEAINVIDSITTTGIIYITDFDIVTGTTFFIDTATTTGRTIITDTDTTTGTTLIAEMDTTTSTISVPETETTTSKNLAPYSTIATGTTIITDIDTTTVTSAITTIVGTTIVVTFPTEFHGDGIMVTGLVAETDATAMVIKELIVFLFQPPIQQLLQVLFLSPPQLSPQILLVLSLSPNLQLLPTFQLLSSCLLSFYSSLILNFSRILPWLSQSKIRFSPVLLILMRLLFSLPPLLQPGPQLSLRLPLQWSSRPLHQNNCNRAFHF